MQIAICKIYFTLYHLYVTILLYPNVLKRKNGNRYKKSKRIISNQEGVIIMPSPSNLITILELLLIIVLVAVLIYSFHHYRELINNKYDERQLIARGQAYKVAFITLCSYLVITLLLDTIFNKLFADYTLTVAIGIIIATVFFSVTCIRNEALFDLNQSYKTYFLQLGSILLINVIIVVGTFLDGYTLVTDGKLNNHFLNFALAVAMLIVIIALAFKKKTTNTSEE